MKIKEGYWALMDRKIPFVVSKIPKNESECLDRCRNGHRQREHSRKNPFKNPVKDF